MSEREAKIIAIMYHRYKKTLEDAGLLHLAELIVNGGLNPTREQLDEFKQIQIII